MLHVKKEYVKATVTCQELMTQAFIAASSIIIEPDDPDKWYEGYLSPECTKDGNYQQIPLGGFICFHANKTDVKKCELFSLIGASVNDYVKVTNIDGKKYRVEYCK